MSRFLILSVSMAALAAVASAGCLVEGYTQRDWPDQHGNCYKVFTNAEWWFFADHRCRADGGWLATIRDENDSIWINSFFISNRGGCYHDWYWVGGTDALKEGEWRWQQDGSKMEFSKWQGNNPDNWYDEDAVIVNSASGFWNDDETLGNTAVCYVCEMYPTERQCSIVA